MSLIGLGGVSEVIKRNPAVLAPAGSPPYTILEDPGTVDGTDQYNLWRVLAGTPTRITPYSSSGPPWAEEITNSRLSPDRTLVVYQENFPGPNGEGQINMVPANGGAVTTLSPDDAGGPWFIHPSWGPNSDRVVYIHADPAEGTNGSIVEVELANPGVETVLYTPVPLGIPNGYGPYRPQYSPDGTKIAFMLFGEVGSNPANEGLYVMNADGTGVTLLDSFSPGYGFDGSQFGWSPDGTLIAYRNSDTTFTGFYVIEPDGTNKRQISIGETLNSPDLGTSVIKRLSQRCWHPDGSHVIGAAQWWDPVNFTIVWRPWRFELDGTTPETRLNDDHGPSGEEFFRCVYVELGRIYMIDRKVGGGRVASLALDGTDYRIDHLITNAGTDFFAGTGFEWR